jgi:hypothetical protein
VTGCELVSLRRCDAAVAILAGPVECVCRWCAAVAVDADVPFACGKRCALSVGCGPTANPTYSHHITSHDMTQHDTQMRMTIERPASSTLRTFTTTPHEQRIESTQSDDGTTVHAVQADLIACKIASPRLGHPYRVLACVVTSARYTFES